MRLEPPARLVGLVLTLLAALGLGACTPKAGDSAASPAAPGKVRVAFITNNASDFWKIAEAGVQKAEAEFADVRCEVKIPANGTPEEQKRIVEEVIARSFSGLAISVIDPASQTGLINEAVQRGLNVLTQDSDAAQSKRLCFVGTNNYQAGRQAGEALKEAIPQGGKVWLFVGKADAQNAIDRKRGLVEAIQGTKIEIVDTRTDDADRQRALANAQDVIAANGDVAALVGLWAYNAPSILEAVKSAKKTGTIKIIAFDEEDRTLQGVKDGHIHATVVQQPYQFGYESVRLLGALARGDKSVVPANGVLDIPTQVIKQDSVGAFWDRLKKLTGKR